MPSAPFVFGRRQTFTYPIGALLIGTVNILRTMGARLVLYRTYLDSFRTEVATSVGGAPFLNLFAPVDPRIVVGMVVTGHANIPASTKITAISGTIATLSANLSTGGIPDQTRLLF